MVDRLTKKVLLAVACCFALVLIPLSTASAQNVYDQTKEGVQKGAEGVQKGAETVGEKTKEGAEAVGEGTKDLVTDDDQDTNKDEITTDRMKPSETKPSEAQSGKSSTTTRTESETTTKTEGEREKEGLPATAGELPLLALVGALALIGSGALKMIRKAPKAN